MDHSRRPATTGFADDFDEFDMLLEDDEPAAGEATPARSARPAGARRPARSTVEPGSGGRMQLRMTPDWNRVAAVVLVGAVLLLVLYLIVSAILDSRRAGSYKDYLGRTSEIATQSTAQGTELAGILAAPGGGPTAQRVAAIEGLSSRAVKLADEAAKVSAPDGLADANTWFVASLRYRADGVQALQRALATSIDSKDADASAIAVSATLQRLVASDVLWADSFAVAARATLRKDGVDGATVPDSTFAADVDGYGPKAVGSMLDRFGASAAPDRKGGATTACKEGTICGGEVGAPIMQPSGTTLVAGGVTEVKGSEDIAFEVPFTNQGDIQLTELPVKITITGKEADPITLTGVIEVVDPGGVAKATIALDEAPNFGETLDYDVLVGPIEGEKTADNNRTTGQIVFTLP